MNTGQVIYELKLNYLQVSTLANVVVRELQPHHMCAPNIWDKH